MLENLSFRKLSSFVLIVLLLVAGVFAAGAYHVNLTVNEINTAWLSFKSQHAEKARLETTLRATLGYGGMIHDFKNYVLRKDFEQLASLQKSLGAAQAIVEQYLALSTTQAEKLVLDDIQQMIFQYQEGLRAARGEIKKGKTSKEIDKLVRIDDSYALRGLDVLHEEIITEYKYYNDRRQKPVLANAIRSMLGYGGMIHSFKNYVLRGDDKYFMKSIESIQGAEEFISQYYQLEHTLGEKTALEDIVKTLEEYKNKLDIAKKMIKKKASPEEIDKVVQVNDKHALRGLTTLEQDIILQIETKSEQLSHKLIEIRKQEALIAYFIVGMILMVSLYLFMLFSKRIIKPVLELSHVMTEMAHGNIDIEYSYSATARTELGDMARSLKIYKENEGKRRIAEEEIRRLAMTDPLTGLANRNRLESRYHELVSHAKREGRLIAVLALDLDMFKPVNDEYGHAAGDAVLKGVARNLLLAFRDTDLVARVGGDEFVVILYGPENIETIKDVAQRVIKLLSAPVLVNEDLIMIGASIGIAILKPDATDPMDVVMKHADYALYQAKESGRNTYRIYDGEGDAKADKVTLVHQIQSDPDTNKS